MLSESNFYVQNLLENHYLNLLEAHCACICLSFDCHRCLDNSKTHHKSYETEIHILSVPPGKVSIQEIECRLISFFELVHILAVSTLLYITYSIRYCVIFFVARGTNTTAALGKCAWSRFHFKIFKIHGGS